MISNKKKPLWFLYTVETKSFRPEVVEHLTSGPNSETFAKLFLKNVLHITMDLRYCSLRPSLSHP